MANIREVRLAPVRAALAPTPSPNFSMANPRQRSKMRSGKAKHTTSVRTRKNKHKVIVKGPEVLVNNYDRHATVRQNYARLGLMPTMNPKQAGGIEAVEGVPYAIASATPATMEDLERLDLEGDAESDDDDDDEEEEDEMPVASTSTASQPGKLAKGFGRIERDENGKVIRIVLAGEDGEEKVEEVKDREEREMEEEDDDDEDSSDEDGEEDDSTPWGKPLPEWEGEGSRPIKWEAEPATAPRTRGQGIPINGGFTRVEAKTDVVRELEQLAKQQTKVIRHTSEFEGDWLMSLVAKYGDDVPRMARDRKANIWQKTPGEIKRMIVKAGGFDKLKAKAAAAH